MTRRTEQRAAFLHAQKQAHLAALTEVEMRRRTQTLAAEGWNDHEIARLLKLDVELVRRWIAEHARLSDESERRV